LSGEGQAFSLSRATKESVVLLDTIDRVARPTEAAAFRFALAAVIAALKDTPAGRRRCRARMLRALESLDDEPIDERTAAASAGAIRLGCRACGKCPGLDAIRPPRLVTELI
jgi:hypothetical protein